MKIHSIRFKITTIIVVVIMAALLTIASACYVLLHREADRTSVEMMNLIGQDTVNTLDEYLVGIEHSVAIVANRAMDCLDSVTLVECAAAGGYAAHEERTSGQAERLETYLEAYFTQVQDTFESIASHTLGCVTYYFCVNPQMNTTGQGFYYSRVGKAGFVEQRPFSDKDLEKKEQNFWYYTSLERGRPSWIGPYQADILDGMWICSYTVPIYCAGTVVGVLGMDIPLQTLEDQVSPIRVYQTGFASLLDEEGRIFYHPELEQGKVPELMKEPAFQKMLTNESNQKELFRYTADGKKRQMSFFTLRNGMKLAVIAPVEEINASWHRLVRAILFATAVAMMLFAAILLIATGVITRPLQRLTMASRKLEDADYDVELDYRGKDEVGELTDAFRHMRDVQKAYTEDLNRRVYTDDLTGLPNMRSFFLTAPKHRTNLLQAHRKPALLYFNLMGMKHFNRQYGYEEGNRLIIAVARILERHYERDCLCRIAQDHFAALTEEDSVEAELKEIFAACQEANNGKNLPVCVGIYRDRTEEVDVSIACDRAKYACDQLKYSTVSAYAYFRKEMQQQILKARYIVNHLDQALSEHWIQVYYQPLVRALNGRVCDEEALSRWNDPEKGFLSPAEFIPALEEAGIIYKMDLYVLEQVLEKMHLMEKEGLVMVPHSVNLSRADFDACDIVEEIRSRVDAAQIPRNRITIEITESVIGSDFDYMKEQVERFRSLGFPVWMDDFGSGYSSLDVLQSIRFDLIKFDMSFMRKLDEGENGKIILTKLMEMATALGVDTVCEGVETEQQRQFLQEIGCSKLQGYYFCKPVPALEVIERNRKGIQIGFENPEESDYYETIGRMNLYDLGMIASEEKNAFRNSFSTLPMGVIEVKESSARFLRSNQTYRDFMEQNYGICLSEQGKEFREYDAVHLHNLMKISAEPGSRLIYDEKTPDGFLVHCFARWIGSNPVTGNIAVAVAVLSVTKPDEKETYAEIARALAADYYNIYVVDLDTERFIEYSSTAGREDLAVERHGEGFFTSVEKDAMQRIYEEDRETFLAAFTRENIMRGLEEQGVFTITYRLVDSGVPVYSNMKVMRMEETNRIIIGISIIDAQMKQKEQLESTQRERDALARIMALSEDYLTLYSIDPDTGHYVEVNATSAYQSLGLSREGEDFFAQAAVNGRKVIWADDLPEYLRVFTKENVLREVQENGTFFMHYRLNMNGEPCPVILRISTVEEGSGQRLVAGIRRWRQRRGEAGSLCTAHGMEGVSHQARRGKLADGIPEQ